MQYIVYPDKRGEYRWQLQANNNKVIADSGEGYKNKSDCIHAIELVKGTNIWTPVVDGVQN